MVRGLLREIAGVTTLRTMSIAYFDTVTDDVIEALWRRDDDDDDDDDGGGEVVEKTKKRAAAPPPPRYARRRPLSLARPLSRALSLSSPPPALITRLELSHLPRVTDAGVRALVDNLPRLTKLRLEVRSIHWSPYDPVRVMNADP